MKPVPLIIMSVGAAIALGVPGLTIGRQMYFRSAGVANQTEAESQIALMTTFSMYAVMLGGLIALGGYLLHQVFGAAEKKAIDRRAEREAKHEAREAARRARQAEREALRRQDPVD
jgi:hypothetical protein